MPVQCNIISLIDLLQDISTFVTVGCRQIKKLKRLLDLTFGTPKQCKLQKHPLRVVLRKYPFVEKSCLNRSPSKNVVKTLKYTFEGVHFWFTFSCRPAHLLKNKLRYIYSTVLAQLQSTHFIEHLPVVYSASVGFTKRRSSGVIQPNDCKLQPQ